MEELVSQAAEVQAASKALDHREQQLSVSTKPIPLSLSLSLSDVSTTCDSTCDAAGSQHKTRRRKCQREDRSALPQDRAPLPQEKTGLQPSLYLSSRSEKM